MNNWLTAAAVVVAAVSALYARVAVRHSRTSARAAVDSAQAAHRSADAAEASDARDADRRADELQAADRTSRGPIEQLVVLALAVKEVGDPQLIPNSTKAYRQPITWTLHLENPGPTALTVQRVTVYFGTGTDDDGPATKTTIEPNKALLRGATTEIPDLPGYRDAWHDLSGPSMAPMPLDCEVTVRDNETRTWRRYRDGRIELQP